MFVFLLVSVKCYPLQTFFEQVQRSIDAGTRPEEVGFQQQFSRMELKRVISAYPAKEVKKGLENLYKKVEKHLVAQSPLLQVVWRDMQVRFRLCYRHRKCNENSAESKPERELCLSLGRIPETIKALPAAHRTVLSHVAHRPRSVGARRLAVLLRDRTAALIPSNESAVCDTRAQ